MPEVLHGDKVTMPVERLDLACNQVLKTLAYFDIFQYPLKKNEIKQFLGVAFDDLTIDSALLHLIHKKRIFYTHHYYSLHENDQLAGNRIHGNLRAALLLPKAQKIGRFLSRFPFVTGIGISGSLSKNVAAEDADIDFFIITKSNRLWIARTFMHLFKKFAFLTGREHFYCMNYYIDEMALLLPDQNIFTAMEVKTLLPVNGLQAFNQFFLSNLWADEWLPLCTFRKQNHPDIKAGYFKKSVEWVFKGRLGDYLDNYFLQVTSRRWKRKQEKGKLNLKGHKMGLITSKHVSRSNPGGFQEKILKVYTQKLELLGIVPG